MKKISVVSLLLIALAQAPLVRAQYFPPGGGGGGTPASPTKSVQTNNSGVFGSVGPTNNAIVSFDGSGNPQASTTIPGTPTINLSNGSALPCSATPALTGDTTTSAGSCATTTKPSVTISTSGPVSDPGVSSAFLFNNASGALTYNLAAGAVGLQRCYRNATGKSGVVTIAVTTSNQIDLNGVNGTVSTGTLVSGGALGDAVCLVSDATNHWYAYVQSGAWTNN